jgi:hypothetical protein
VNVCILDGRSGEDASRFCLDAGDREYAVIGRYGVIIHKEYSLTPVVRRKGNIVGVLQVVGEIVLAIGVDQRVYEVNIKGVYPTILKELVDLRLWSTRTVFKCIVTADTYLYTECL